MKRTLLIAISILILTISQVFSDNTTIAKDKQFTKDTEKLKKKQPQDYPAMTTGSVPEDNGKRKLICPEPRCGEIFQPLCVSVNGMPLTAVNNCRLDAKIKCYPKLLKPGEKMPTFRVLHQNACSDAEQNAWVRAHTPGAHHVVRRRKAGKRAKPVGIVHPNKLKH